MLLNRMHDPRRTELVLEARMAALAAAARLKPEGSGATTTLNTARQFENWLLRDYEGIRE